MTPFNTALVASLPKLRTYALWLTRDRGAAEDLVQDVALKALRFSDKFAPGSNMEAWLTIVARNTWRTGFRKAGRFVSLDPEFAADTLIAISDPDTVLELAEVTQAISCMSVKHQLAILAVGVLGEEYAEAGERLGVPAGTIKSRVNRVRLRLSEQFDRPAGYGPREAQS